MQNQSDLGRIDFHHAFLNTIYNEVNIAPEFPQMLRHEQLVHILEELNAKYPQHFSLESIGESVENRAIYYVKLGSGPRSIFMWSQMHGNEPTATNALMNIFTYLLRYRDESFVKTILENTTLHIIPMLNPDGAEANLRRNAQGLDLNRDALDLASPEARLLRAIRDKIEPEFGFNLHDQNGRRTVGNTNKLVAIALMVPPFDENDNDNSGRIEAKRVASVMQQALSPYIYGHIARYEAAYMPQAFGDTMQSLGTKTVLLESGGWFEDDPAYLVRMNFIAILEACYAIATNDYKSANPGLYDALPFNDKELFDLLIQSTTLIDGASPIPYPCDIGINFNADVMDNEVKYRGVITDIGDMHMYNAKEYIDGSGLIALPGLVGLVPAANNPADEAVQALIRKGYTTILHEFPAQQLKSIASIGALVDRHQLRTNTGFLFPFSHLAHVPLNEQATIIGEALFSGVLGTIKSEKDPKMHPLVNRLVKWFHRPVFERPKLENNTTWIELIEKENKLSQNTLFKPQGLFGRGRLRIGDFADFVLYEGQHQKGETKLAKLVGSFVNGRQILEADGSIIAEFPGMVLKR